MVTLMKHKRLTFEQSSPELESIAKAIWFILTDNGDEELQLAQQDNPYVAEINKHYKPIKVLHMIRWSMCGEDEAYVYLEDKQVEGKYDYAFWIYLDGCEYVSCVGIDENEHPADTLLRVCQSDYTIMQFANTTISNFRPDIVKANDLGTFFENLMQVTNSAWSECEFWYSDNEIDSTDKYLKHCYAESSNGISCF
jgi:hypothetical protein